MEELREIVRSCCCYKPAKGEVGEAHEGRGGDFGGTDDADVSLDGKPPRLLSTDAGVKRDSFFFDISASLLHDLR